MSEPPPGEVPDLDRLDQYRYWKPEVQQRALELLKEREHSPWRPFYCPDLRCDGHPHGEWDFEHARSDQRPPRWSDDWLVWALAGGRGSGKTRAGAEVTHRVTKITPRIILIGPTGPDLRETMVEGVSGLLATAAPDNRPVWEPSKKKLTWPNGCIAQGFSAEEPDRLRGPQCFVAGTLIQTERGAVPIEQVTIADWVWTRHGLRRVMAVNKGQRVVMSSSLFTATPDHLIWTENRGWVEHQFIVPDDTMAAWCPTCTPRQAATASSRPDRAPCTTPGGSGSRNTGRFLTGGMSTTSTSTAPTTGSRTSSPCHGQTTRNCTRLSGVRTVAPTAEVTSTSSEVVLVGAAPSASAGPTETLADAPTSAVAVAGSSPAKSAGLSSRRAGDGSAPSGASTSDVQTVYDLTVDEHPEFFANGILVHNSGYVWADEPAHYPDSEQVWDNMLFGLRIKGHKGTHPKVVATTTPKPTKWMKALLADPLTVTHRVSTYANLQNLADTFKRTVIDRYEGTRLGKQELHGEVLQDVEGALWNWDMFQWVDDAPPLLRIVVAVDPAGTANKKSDETGIITIGIGHDKNLYVLHDATDRYSPERWGSMSNAQHEDFSADAIVAEKNYGADMVRYVLENSGHKGARIIEVQSRRGKAIRAEPIVALYEKKRVFHVGSRGDLGALEDELTSWVPGASDSPNRLDALVHGATELAKQVMPATVSDPNKLLRGRHAPTSRHLRAV